MKKLAKHLTPLFVLLLVLFMQNVSYASSITAPVPNKTNVLIPLSKYLKASEFIKLSAREFSNLTGRKLNFFQRLSFKIVKMRMKHDLKKNPDLKLTDYRKGSGEGSSSFNIIWFIIGLAGPLIGIFTGGLAGFIILAVAPLIIAYATKQDRTNIKSVWMGFAIGVIFILILVAIVAVSLYSGFE